MARDRRYTAVRIDEAVRWALISKGLWIKSRQVREGWAPPVRVEVWPVWSAKAATGVRVEDYRYGMAFAEAVIAAQGEDLVEIGWSAKEVYELRDELAAVAWGWMGKCRGSRGREGEG